MSAPMYGRTVWSIARRAWGSPPSRARGTASAGWDARLLATVLVLASLAPVDVRADDADACAGPLALQVLGSGGPDTAQGRASSGYLLRIDGRGRALVDAGAGVQVALGRAGVEFADLRWIALSHLHVDHAADLVAILKAGYFSERTTPLPLFGPIQGGVFPSLDQYVQRLLGDSGAYAYLSGYLDGSDGLVALQPHAVAAQQVSLLLDEDGLRLEALAVPHGPVPVLAYRITVGARRIVLAGDTTAAGDALIAFARDADLLVMHLAIAESAESAARGLHALPSRIGEVAAAAAPRRLVLSHLMARSLAQLPDALRRIRARYRGPVQVAQDGLCVPLK